MHNRVLASAVESQSTASSAAIGISTTTTGSDDSGLLARQPPIGIETAAATNPTLASLRGRLMGWFGGTQGHRQFHLSIERIRLPIRF